MRNKKEMHTGQPLDRPDKLEDAVMRRPVVRYLNIVPEGFTEKSDPDGRFQTLTSLALMSSIVTGPAILVCAASESFETLGVMLMMYLAGAVSGAVIFCLGVGEGKSHVLIDPKNNNPDDVQMLRAA